MRAAAGKTGGRRSATRPMRRKAFPVPVAAVTSRTVPVYLDYVGTTEALRYVTMQAKVTGYLAQYLVEDGADVKQGDLIYKIDDRDFQATLDQVKGATADHVAALEYAKGQSRPQLHEPDRRVVAKDTNDEKTSLMHQPRQLVADRQGGNPECRADLELHRDPAPFDGRLGKTQVHEGT